MRILFYFGHPAQYLFLRETLRRLLSNNHQIKILIKTKDVLETLLLNDDFDYENILPKERGRTKFAIVWSLVKRNIKLFPIVFKFKPDLLIGSDASVAQVGKLLNIQRVTVGEDDFEIIKTLARLTYPFTQTILCPGVCKVGKWVHKKVGYEGYMKLGYLHPNIFKFKKAIVEKYNMPSKYVLIRLAKLSAHHDFSIKGIDTILLDKLINVFESSLYKVFISAERSVENKYKSYLLSINPNDIHHILAASSFLISDSQSMSIEAAFLGVPSIRFSGFAGRISVLEELEHKYKLTFGVNPKNPELLLSKLNELLTINDLKKDFQKRRKKCLQIKLM